MFDIKCEVNWQTTYVDIIKYFARVIIRLRFMNTERINGLQLFQEVINSTEKINRFL